MNNGGNLMGNSIASHLEHFGQINLKHLGVFHTVSHYSQRFQNNGWSKKLVGRSPITFLQHAGSHTSEFIESNKSILLTFSGMVITSGAMQEVDRVALRCEAPLDAIELENHGYHYVFFERENNVFMETFTTLNQLGIHTLVYFCDVSGPQFDINKMTKFANRFDIKLCKVLLPFCPYNFALWDESQWRIFDTRLSLALNKKRSQPHPMKLLCGGLSNALIH
jgi:hypothetical protein